jgi:integrase/recombinase XerD
VVEVIRKSTLPTPDEVIPQLRKAAAEAHTIKLREPRPAGFPLFFSSALELIEPAIAYLHEHAIQRAHSAETLRTYAEALFDWLDALEQSGVPWGEADAADLVAYRNRMLNEPSGHTGRPYGIRTINHRVRNVLRFYEWMVRNGWLDASDLVGRAADFKLARSAQWSVRRFHGGSDRGIFVLRQYEALPRPLSSPQALEILARLSPPYDLMARWQLYTGLRVSELLRLTVNDVQSLSPEASRQVVEVMRKGRKSGYVIASESLLEETAGYVSVHRDAWLKRAARMRRAAGDTQLFINSRGRPVKKITYQQVISQAGADCGFKVTTHLLRATFACMMLARLEHLAKQGAAINPLLIVKILMGHEQIETTDRYLRAIAVDAVNLPDLLDSLLVGA